MKRVLQLVSEDFEDLELWCPVMRLREAGAEVVLAAEKPGLYHGKYGVPCEVKDSFNELDAKDFDALLVPGGWAPDKLRRFDKVLEITRDMNAQNKPIGIICHAGWVLASAEILQGKKVTSTPGIKDDMTHAGAIWLDEPVVVDKNLISARRPPDIPDYCRALVDMIFKEKG
ncbi:MAG: type 1 glutamine amidotransferase [Butyrivibrio sp.]|nr:type 1 glutamine amidotransferase [Butyrivibrio sp.]